MRDLSRKLTSVNCRDYRDYILCGLKRSRKRVEQCVSSKICSYKSKIFFQLFFKVFFKGNKFFKQSLYLFAHDVLALGHGGL